MAPDKANVLGQQNASDNFVVVRQQVHSLKSQGIGDVQREADRLDREVFANADGRWKRGHGCVQAIFDGL